MSEKPKEENEQATSSGLDDPPCSPCRCGRRAAPNAKQCPVCAEKSRNYARERYRIKNGIPLNRPVGKRGRKRKVATPSKTYKKAMTKITGGVTRQVNTDGNGRTDVWYVASVMIKGKSFGRKWSVNKHGEETARLLATLQKMMWLMENGVWKRCDGDPLAILSYEESFSGNRDYEECLVSDVTSPFIFEYEDA